MKLQNNEMYSDKHNQRYSSDKPVNIPLENIYKELKMDVAKEAQTDTVYQIENIIPENQKTLTRSKNRKVKKSKKWVRKVSSTSKKDTVKLVQERKEIHMLWTVPKTRKEAENIARKIHTHCQSLIQLNRNDSLYLYATHGLSMFENSSLFYIKAYALFHKKHYEEAIEACHIASTRNDFWVDDERIKIINIELNSLVSINEKYPSRITKEKIDELQRTAHKTSY